MNVMMTTDDGEEQEEEHEEEEEAGDNDDDNEDEDDDDDVDLDDADGDADAHSSHPDFMAPGILGPPMKQKTHMVDCQNSGPFLGPLHARCRIILRTQKGTRMLTTTHMQKTLQTPSPVDLRLQVASELGHALRLKGDRAYLGLQIRELPRGLKGLSVGILGLVRA